MGMVKNQAGERLRGHTMSRFAAGDSTYERQKKDEKFSSEEGERTEHHSGRKRKEKGKKKNIKDEDLA